MAFDTVRYSSWPDLTYSAQCSGGHGRLGEERLGVPGQVWEFTFLPSFPSFPRENRSSRNVWENSWKSHDILLPDIRGLLTQGHLREWHVFFFGQLEKAVAVRNSLLERFSGKFRRCWKMIPRFSGSAKCYPCRGLGTSPAAGKLAAPAGTLLDCLLRDRHSLLEFF